jgi:RNA recognition motif-containing protein
LAVLLLASSFQRDFRQCPRDAYGVRSSTLKRNCPAWEGTMKKLYVGNLPFSASEGDLESMFSQYGQLESVSLVRDRDSGQPRGFAFVEFGDDAAAEAAIAGTNGKEMGGRALMVNEARPQAPRSGGGGGGRGYGGGGGGGRGGYGGGGGGGRGYDDGDFSGGRRKEPRW